MKTYCDCQAEKKQSFHRVVDAMPVELLRDRRGIYGIGVSEQFDIEALAWACGVEQPDRARPPHSLILRPDYFDGTKPHGAVLQRITGGFRHGIFCRSQEEHLRQFCHHEALRRAGLPWPPPDALNSRQPSYWSDDKAQQARNRGIYHGLRILSLGVINHLIGELHEAAANQDAVRAARRFHFRYREEIYRAAAVSRRALQLTETFPFAAHAIYSLSNPQAREAAANLVERGARLRDVAAALGIPMAFRHVKPGVAHLVWGDLIQHPDLLRWMPRTTPAARIWLLSVKFAHEHGDIDYARWVARHVPEMPGRLDGVAPVVTDVLDWVHANAGGSGRQFVTRPFTPAMGLKAATQASHEWHEAVASNMDGPDGLALPPPWYPAAKQGAFEIVPLATSAELYREGSAMHHCVATYVDEVRYGAVIDGVENTHADRSGFGFQHARRQAKNGASRLTAEQSERNHDRDHRARTRQEQHQYCEQDAGDDQNRLRAPGSISQAFRPRARKQPQATKRC